MVSHSPVVSLVSLRSTWPWAWGAETSHSVAASRRRVRLVAGWPGDRGQYRTPSARLELLGPAGRGRAAWSGASRRPNHECPCHATPPGSLPKHARRATRSGTMALTRPTGATASSTAWARALAWATPKCWHCRRMMHARRVIRDRIRPAVDCKRESGSRPHCPAQSSLSPQSGRLTHLTSQRPADAGRGVECRRDLWGGQVQL